MTASASFQISINGGAYQPAGVAQDAPPSATVACRLVSTSGVNPSQIAWSNFGTHTSTQAQLVPVLSGTPTGQIATFTLPATATGQAYGLECKVNGGASVTGINATTCRSAVYCLDGNGIRPAFINELWERSSTHGIVGLINGILGAISDHLHLLYLAFGATTAASGDIRADDTFAIKAMHGAGTTVSLLDWTGPDLTIGESSANMGTLSLMCGTHAGAELDLSVGANKLVTLSATTLDFLGTTAITATGNPTVSLGTGVTTAGTVRAQAEASVGTASGAYERTYVLKGTSTDIAPVELTTDGGAPAGGNVLTPPLGSCWSITTEVSCMCTAGTDVGRAASFWLHSGVANPAGGGALAILSPAQSSLSTAAAWSGAVPALPAHYNHANLANCGVTLDVSGVAGHWRCSAVGVAGGAANTFHWTATVRIAEASA